MVKPLTPAVQRRAPLLSVDQVANHLNVSSKTIRRKVDSGELPVIRLGRLLRFSENDVSAYLSSMRR